MPGLDLASESTAPLLGRVGGEMAKTVLITGSSSGIGQVTAQLFAAREWNVAATARDPASIERWAVGNVAAFRLDVTDEASIEAAVAATVRRFATIDVLVNNAGIGVFGPLEGITADQLQRQFQTNVFGAAAMIRHVLAIMRPRRSGTIINVSSIAGRISSPFSSAYDSSKHALEGLSESLRFELKLHGIRMKLIEPGHFKTDFLTRSAQWATHSAYESESRNWMGWMALSDQTSSSPGPVAKTIFKAATDSSGRLRYVVKGGMSLAIRAILPDAMWRSLIGAGMTRKPKGRASGEPMGRAD